MASSTSLNRALTTRALDTNATLHDDGRLVVTENAGDLPVGAKPATALAEASSNTKAWSRFMVL